MHRIGSSEHREIRASLQGNINLPQHILVMQPHVKLINISVLQSHLKNEHKDGPCFSVAVKCLKHVIEQYLVHSKYYINVTVIIFI